MDQEDVDELRELRKRIARLEAASTQRRYNQTQAARRLNMSVSKFRSLRAAGRVTGKLIGRIWSFTNDDLDALDT